MSNLVSSVRSNLVRLAALSLLGATACGAGGPTESVGSSEAELNAKLKQQCLCADGITTITCGSDVDCPAPPPPTCNVPASSSCASLASGTVYNGYTVVTASGACPSVNSINGTWVGKPQGGAFQMNSIESDFISTHEYTGGAETYCNYLFQASYSNSLTTEQEAAALCAIAPADGLGISCLPTGKTIVYTMGCVDCAKQLPPP
ncbi:MAG: hypothetical protein ACHREM_24685 [Polyangiales bacterium]